MRRVLGVVVAAMLLVGGLEVAKAAIDDDGPFRNVSGFAIKTGFRGVFSWSAENPVEAVVHYGVDPDRLVSSVPALPNAPDRAGLAIANGLEIGKTYYFQIEDRLSGKRSAIRSFEAANAWNAWDEEAGAYTINLLVQLDSQALPPEVAGDRALAELAQGMSIFAERVHDATDGFVRLGKVLVTDTNLDYAVNVPFVWPQNVVRFSDEAPVDNPPQVCERAGANLADVLVETVPPADSHTFAGFAIEQPCTSFYVGRMGWLRIPTFQWRSDLDFAATAAHELAHYAFNAPDLYTIPEPSSADDPECHNDEFDVSLMSNDTKWDSSAGRWFYTELDRDAETTPCQMGGEPFSWQVMAERYPEVAAGQQTVEHIVDTKARGNEDGGVLDIDVLDREPSTSTLTDFTPDDRDDHAPPPCAPTAPQLDDPTGDNWRFNVVEGQSTGGPATDVDSVTFASPQDGLVTMTIKVAALERAPDPGTNGEFFITDFLVDGVPYSARAERVVPFPDSFSVTTPDRTVDVSGAVDVGADTLRIDIPSSVIPWSSGVLVDRIAIVSYAAAGVVGVGADEASAACTYRVGQDDFPTNTLPVAVDDAATTEDETAVTIDVLANDSDADGDGIRVYSTRPARNGTVELLGDGSAVVYRPKDGWSGTDSFSYTAYDGRGGAASARVTVTVVAAPDPPHAVDDQATTTSGSATTIDVLVNDRDVDGDELRLAEIEQPLAGAATIAGSSVRYEPPPGFTGRDRFAYTVETPEGGRARGVVLVKVLPADCLTSVTQDFEGDIAGAGWAAERVDGQSVESAFGAPALVGHGPSLDWQPRRDPLATSGARSAYSDDNFAGGKDDRLVSPAVEPTPTSRMTFQHRHHFEQDPVDATNYDGGVLEITSDGGVTWHDIGADRIVENGYNGVISDGDTAIANRRAFVATSSDPGHPVVPRAMERVVVDLGDYAGQTVQLRWRLVTDSNTGAMGWFVDDVQVTDLVKADCVLQTVPFAFDDEVRTREDHAVTVRVLDNDVDTDGDQLTVTAAGDAAHGSTSVGADGVRYEPDPDFNGTDTFTYTVSDGKGGAASARVTVAVTAVNDAPEAVDDRAATRRNRARVIDVLANDVDADHEKLRIVWVTDAKNGTATITDGGAIRYEPRRGFTGTDRFDYVARDRAGARSRATVIVTVARR